VFGSDCLKAMFGLTTCFPRLMGHF